MCWMRDVMLKIERDLWNSTYNTSISRVKFVWTWVGPPYTIQSFPLYFLFALTLLYHTETQPPPFVRWAPKSRSRSKGGKFDCSLRESKRVNEPINLMSRWRMVAGWMGGWAHGFYLPPPSPPRFLFSLLILPAVCTKKERDTVDTAENAH